MRLRSTASLLVVLAGVAAAQESEPVFRSRTDLVTVPVVVTRDGQPVRGLKKEDFQLLHNGKKEKLAVFEEVAPAAANSAAAAAVPNEVQNYVPTSSRDVVIIVISANDWYSENNVRAYLSDMAKSLEATHTPASVLLFVRDTLIQIHSFASAAGDITRSVDEYLKRNRVWRTTANDNAPPGVDTTTADFPGAYFEQARMRDDRLRLDAVSQIAAAYRGIPGRKKLIWMGSGFFSAAAIPAEVATRDRSRAGPSPLSSEQEAAERSAAADPSIFAVAAMREAAWKKLSDANIAVYPLDLHGIPNPAYEERFASSFNGGDRFSASGAESRLPRGAMARTLSMIEVAHKTGGKNCTDLPDRCVNKIQEDGNEYYVLGFYLPKDAKPGWHELQVQAARPGVAVRARSGFVVDAPVTSAGTAAAKVALQSVSNSGQRAPAAAPDRDEVLVALAAPVDYTSVPLRLRWSVSPGNGPMRQVELFLNSPPGGVNFDPADGRFDVDVLAFVRPVGKLEGTGFPQSLSRKLAPADRQRLATGGFAFKKVIHLAPGRYGLRVLIRDNTTGKIGTVSSHLDLK